MWLGPRRGRRRRGRHHRLQPSAAAKPTGGTLEALLPTINESTGVLTDSTDAKTETDTPITLTDFQNKLNLQADIYVGGIGRRKRRRHEADDSKCNERRNGKRPVRRRPEPVQQRRV